MALLPLLCQIASGKEIKAAAEPGSTKREKIFPTLMERLRAAELNAMAHGLYLLLPTSPAQ